LLLECDNTCLIASTMWNSRYFARLPVDLMPERPTPCW